MKVRWFGHSCFQLRTEDGVRIVTDPYDPTVGTLPADLTADIVTVSHQHFDHNYVTAVKGRYEMFTGPGAHEAAGVKVTGIHSWHDEQMGAKRGPNTIFVIEADGLRICHMGDLGAIPGKEELLSLQDLDYVMVPVGGTYTLDPQGADRLISMIGPRVVIPMHYGMKPGLDKLIPVARFIEGKDDVIHAASVEYTMVKPVKKAGRPAYLLLKP